MKVQGWETKLAEYINKMRHEPFVREKHDCTMFAANCIELMTKKDLAEEFRGKYHDAETAYKLLLDMGYTDLVSVARKKLGKPLKTPKLAQRGDLVCIEGHEGQTFAIVDLSGRYAVFPGRNEMQFSPMKNWIMAWRV
jgi:hypothetical protein